MQSVEHQGEKSMKPAIQHILNSISWIRFLGSNTQNYDKICQS